MNIWLLTWLFLLLGNVLFIANGAYCETYSWTDDNGALHFSDTPPASMKKEKRRTPIKKSEIEVTSKWVRQKNGYRLYENDQISVVITKDENNQLIFNVMYKLSPDMEQYIHNGMLRISVSPWDLSLPQGVSSYLSSSTHVPQALSGNIEMQASPTDNTPGGVSSSSIAISISIDNQDTGKRRYELWRVVPYRKDWS